MTLIYLEFEAERPEDYEKIYEYYDKFEERVFIPGLTNGISYREAKENKKEIEENISKLRNKIYSELFKFIKNKFNQ